MDVILNIIWLITIVISYFILRKAIKYEEKWETEAKFPGYFLMLLIPIFNILLSLLCLCLNWLSTKETNFREKFFRVK